MLWKPYRSRFPMFEHQAHLAHCSQAPQSLDVRQAIEEYLDDWKTHPLNWSGWLERVNAARRSFAALINADADEVAVIGSLSDAICAVSSALGAAGSTRSFHVLTTANEFPTVNHAWLAGQEAGRFTLTIAAAVDGGYDETSLDPYWADNTGLLSVHHVSYDHAVKQDLGALAALAHRRDAWLLVDAYQSLGTMRVDVKQLELDFLCSGSLKFLLGIPGIAFLYVRRAIAEQLQPANVGWFGSENPLLFDATKLTYAPGARRFQTGTPPIAAAYAAKAGIDLLIDAGLEAIETRLQSLSAHTVRAALARDLSLASPSDARRKGATTAIRVDNAAAVETYLANHGVYASARGDVIRIAPHFYTEEAEIDAALDLLSRLPRSTQAAAVRR